MEIDKTINGAMLVFIGSILIGVGFNKSIEGNLLVGIPLAVFGAYLTFAIYYSHIFRHLLMRYRKS